MAKFEELSVEYQDIADLKTRVEKLNNLKTLLSKMNGDVSITIGGNKDKFLIQASGLFGLINSKLQQDEAELNQRLNKITIK